MEEEIKVGDVFKSGFDRIEVGAISLDDEIIGYSDGKEHDIMPSLPKDDFAQLVKGWEKWKD